MCNMDRDRLSKFRMDSDLFMCTDPGFENVYSELIEVSVVEDACEYKVYCNLKVEETTKQRPTKEKIIGVKIMGINNPFFVFKGLLNAADYENIKSEHCLFVDFTKFVGVFLNLLRQCVSSTRTSHRYVLRIEESLTHTLLKVVEINDLRQMTHLYIKIQRCSEDEAKRIITDRINLLQEERQKFMLKMEDSEAQLSNFEAEIFLQKAQIDQIIDRYESKISQMKENHGKNLAVEREKTQHLLGEREKQHQKELDLKDEEIQANKVSWECEVRESSALLTNAQTKIGLLAVHEKSLQQSLEERDAEIIEMKRINAELVKDIDSVKRHMERKELELRKIGINYKEVLKDFMDVSTRTAKQEVQLDEVEKDNEAMRQKIEKYKKEQSIQIQSIERLTKELSTAKNHLAEGRQKYVIVADQCEKAAELMVNQEKALEDMKKLLSDHQKEKGDLEKENKALNETIKEITEKIESMKIELRHQERNLKSTESVISYLTKQVKSTKSSDLNTGLQAAGSRSPGQNRLTAFTSAQSSSDTLSLGPLSLSGATGYLHHHHQQQQQQLSAQVPVVPSMTSTTMSVTSQQSATILPPPPPAAAATSSYFTKKKTDSS